MFKVSSIIRAGLVGVLTFSAAASVANAQIDQAVRIAQESTQAGQQSQDRVESLDDARVDLAREYRAVLQQIESQQLFVEQQQVFLRSQQNEIESLEAQIGRVESVKVELLPMMREMVEALDNFVQLDLPFLAGERSERIAGLYEILDDAEVSVAERYRIILNAYDIEASYGRGIDSYEGPLTDGGNDVVDFLMIGRLMLIYKRKDSDEFGYWDRESGSWMPLRGDYGLELNKAFRIARQTAAPGLLLVPIPGPTDGEMGSASASIAATPDAAASDTADNE